MAWHGMAGRGGAGGNACICPPASRPCGKGASLVRRPLRHPLPHLNDPAQSLQQVFRLVRGQPMDHDFQENKCN